MPLAIFLVENDFFWLSPQAKSRHVACMLRRAEIDLVLANIGIVEHRHHPLGSTRNLGDEKEHQPSCFLPSGERQFRNYNRLRKLTNEPITDSKNG